MVFRLKFVWRQSPSPVTSLKGKDALVKEFPFNSWILHEDSVCEVQNLQLEIACRVGIGHQDELDIAISTIT